ncbi:hypothetical protein FRC10_004036, partial [Ceratobasidium sp. 414]
SNTELILEDDVIQLLKRLISGHDSILTAHAVHVIAALAEDPQYSLEGVPPPRETVGLRLAKKSIISDIMFALSKLRMDGDETPQIPVARRLPLKGSASFHTRAQSHQLIRVITGLSQAEVFEYDIMCIVAGLVTH